MGGYSNENKGDKKLKFKLILGYIGLTFAVLGLILIIWGFIVFPLVIWKGWIALKISAFCIAEALIFKKISQAISAVL